MLPFRRSFAGSGTDGVHRVTPQEQQSQKEGKEGFEKAAKPLFHPEQLNKDASSAALSHIGVTEGQLQNVRKQLEDRARSLAQLSRDCPGVPELVARVISNVAAGESSVSIGHIKQLEDAHAQLNDIEAYARLWRETHEEIHRRYESAESLYKSQYNAMYLVNPDQRRGPGRFVRSVGRDLLIGSRGTQAESEALASYRDSRDSAAQAIAALNALNVRLGTVESHIAELQKIRSSVRLPNHAGITRGLARTNEGLAKLVQATDKILGTPPRGERAPEGAARVRDRIIGVMDGTRDMAAHFLDPVAANKIGNEFQQSVKAAQNRFGLSDAEYQRNVVLAEGQREVPGQHFCRVRLRQPPGPRVLRILVNGNRQSLTPQATRGEPPGMTSLFDQFAGHDVNLIQFAVGSAVTADPRRTNAAAWEHLRNIVNDALNGRGMFQGHPVTAIQIAGYSYGAGAIVRLSRELEAARKTNANIPRITHTASLDGVGFMSVPPSALTARPASGRHFHIWQGTANAVGFPIAGGAPAETREGDRSLHVSRSSHARIDTARLHPEVFKDIAAFFQQ